MGSVMTPAYQLTAPSAHPYRPTFNRSEMESLLATQQDINVLIANTKKYIASPQCDFGEKARLEGFLESLYQQRDELQRQLNQAV
jgi:hypothetical protein